MRKIFQTCAARTGIPAEPRLGGMQTLLLHMLWKLHEWRTGKANDTCFELISKTLGFVVWERMDLNDSH